MICIKKRYFLILSILDRRENEQANRIFVTLFRFNHYGLTTNTFSTDIVRTLSKKNRFSIGRCDKFVGHVRRSTVISYPA